MKKLLTLFLVLGLSTIFYAQGMGGGGWTHGDTLTTVSVTGTAIVDSSTMYPMYYLDEDGDGTADYHLSFGPYWYQPDSSNAVRPVDGDVVTISGGLRSNDFMNNNTIIVYEINGEFWRDPIVSSWNDMGGGSHGGHCGGFGGGSDVTLIDTSLAGIVYVDTTFFMDRYYLDTDADQVPDYSLNFGPPWYEPASGALRPSDGDSVSIAGKLLNNDVISMVIVYELNGQVWRDSSSMGNQFGGTWFDKDMTFSAMIHSPFDMEDWMQVNPGWNNGGMGGMMGHDSLYGQMLEVFPQNMPNAENENVFAGYSIGMFTPNGTNEMWNNGTGGMMNFNSNVNYQLHYNDIQVQGYGIDENTIVAKYWNSQNNSWEIINDAVLDKTNNTVTFSSNTVSSSVILDAQPLGVTGVNDKSELLIKGFTLKQNYPNPFNPSTIIEYSIHAVDTRQALSVQLNVYDVLGREVATLVNKKQVAGNYSVQFDASNLSSGIYFYQLKVGSLTSVKKMNLLK